MKVSIKSITISDGTEVLVPEGGLLLFVGPNNAGKSAALKEIHSYMGGQGGLQRVIKFLEVRREGDGDDVISWLETHTEKQPYNNAGELGYMRTDNQAPISPDRVKSIWDANGSLQELWPLLALYMNAKSRLEETSSGVYDVVTQRPSHPLQYLWTNEKLRDQLSQACEEVFDAPLTLAPYPPSLRLHLGHLELPKSPNPDAKVIVGLQKAPLLDEQGDGMRSYMYIVLNMMVHENFCVLIDEPEVFLHPPQAMTLGRYLRKAVGTTQVFASTHSSDILRGVLNTRATSDVTVVRLMRDGDINRASVLDSAKVKELWADSLLRYSNLLDGLFHHTTVLCEGDADCRFYSAVLDELGEDRGRYTSEDLHFAYASTKHRLANMATALRAVEVRVRIIVDIDILDDAQTLKKLLTSQGEIWTADIEKDVRILNKGIRDLGKTAKQTFVKQELAVIVSKLGGPDPLTEEQKKEIESLITDESGWSQVKRAGKAAIPAGQAMDSFNRLNRVLKESDIFIVEVGELERFVPEVGGHGPKWLSGVLEKSLQVNAAKKAAGDFMKRVASKS